MTSPADWSKVTAMIFALRRGLTATAVATVVGCSTAQAGGSHLTPISHPDALTAVIGAAAGTVR
jgi:hypothetical protein